jgi:hypothetical protein
LPIPCLLLQQNLSVFLYLPFFSPSFSALLSIFHFYLNLQIEDHFPPENPFVKTPQLILALSFNVALSRWARSKCSVQYILEKALSTIATQLLGLSSHVIVHTFFLTGIRCAFTLRSSGCAIRFRTLLPELCLAAVMLAEHRACYRTGGAIAS